jgi:predicted nucleic-acid-binding Zn-ribbon protein
MQYFVTIKVDIACGEESKMISIKKPRGHRMVATCKRCYYRNTPDFFDGSDSVYHDLKCPKCGTTKIDTSEISKEFRDYGFGPDNFMQAFFRLLYLERETI